MATESHCLRNLLLPASAPRHSGPNLRVLCFWPHWLVCTSPYRAVEANRSGCTKQRCSATNPPLWYAWRLWNKSYKEKIVLPFNFSSLHLSIAFNCTVIWLKSLPGGNTVTLIHTGGGPGYNSEVSRSKEREENSSWCITYFRKTETSKSVRTVPLSLFWLFIFFLLHQNRLFVYYSRN